MTPEDDPRQPGEALWPERFPVSYWEAQRAQLGAWLYAAMGDQRPIPLEGGLFKASWFGRRFRTVAGGWLLDGHPDAALDSQSWRFSVVDPATGKTALSDYTAVLTCAVTPWNQLLLLDVVSERIRLEDFVRRLGAVAGVWRPEYVAMEANGFQVTLAREVREKLPWLPVMEVQPEGKSKLVRALPAIARAEAGEILLPYPEPAWVGPFLEELCNWTATDGERDDVVDCLSYAVAQLGFGGCGAAAVVPAGDAGRPAVGGWRDRR